MLAFALTRVFALRCRTRLPQRHACDKRQHGALAGSVRRRRWAFPVRDTLLSPPPSAVTLVAVALVADVSADAGQGAGPGGYQQDGRLDKYDIEFFEDGHADCGLGYLGEAHFFGNTVIQ